MLSAHSREDRVLGSCPVAPGSILGIPDVAEIYFYQSHLVLVSGKLVLRKNESNLFQRSGLKRKLSLSEKLASSPEFRLIDKQTEELFLSNVQSVAVGTVEIGSVVGLSVVVASVGGMCRELSGC